MAAWFDSLKLLEGVETVDYINIASPVNKERGGLDEVNY